LLLMQNLLELAVVVVADVELPDEATETKTNR
jgi:hypothetical protein